MSIMSFLHTAHLLFYTIFNISRLKIVSSSEMESRQSNKCDAMQRGGNEKGSSFVIRDVFSSFSLLINGKELRVEVSLGYRSPFALPAPVFTSQPLPFPFCFSLPTTGTALLGTPREFPSCSLSSFFFCISFFFLPPLGFCFISFRLLFSQHRCSFCSSRLNRT